VDSSSKAKSFKFHYFALPISTVDKAPLNPRETIFARSIMHDHGWMSRDDNMMAMRRFDGSADPKSYMVMKRKMCFFPGLVGCINILMIYQFYPHFLARHGFHRGACPQSMRE
jgi:hypothetical protein